MVLLKGSRLGSQFFSSTLRIRRPSRDKVTSGHRTRHRCSHHALCAPFRASCTPLRAGAGRFEGLFPKVKLARSSTSTSFCLTGLSFPSKPSPPMASITDSPRSVDSAPLPPLPHPHLARLSVLEPDFSSVRGKRAASPRTPATHFASPKMASAAPSINEARPHGQAPRSRSSSFATNPTAHDSMNDEHVSRQRGGSNDD